jgi:hypothetical protein
MVSSAPDDCLCEITTLTRKLQLMSRIWGDFKLIDGNGIYSCQISASPISNCLTNITFSLLRLN